MNGTDRGSEHATGDADGPDRGGEPRPDGAGQGPSAVRPHPRGRTVLTDGNAREEFERAIAELPPAPDAPFEGRGIVVCGGGLKYLPSAWVCINMLRHLGCRLPVELWHLGRRELPDELRPLLGPLGVTCVDAERVRDRHPARTLNGWELKPYAVIHSRFREVLLLDADNVAAADPTFLFESDPYRSAGAIFWPDYGRLDADRAIWGLTGVPFRSEPEFETGQLVVDKARCWAPLMLTMWMNEHSDFWYRHVHGDKETFHLAWRKLGRPYAMPARGIHPLPGTMCQHDFAGHRAFQHRNMHKWLTGPNPVVPGFRYEADCLRYLAELRPYGRLLAGLPPVDPALQSPLVGRSAEYVRVGHDRRPMSFEAGGRVGDGAARLEQFWGVVQEGDVPVLEIWGEDGVTARLRRDPRDPNRWTGRWLVHERMPIDLRVSAA